MHVLQWIAVRDEDAHNAVAQVDSYLTTNMGGGEYAINSWYDWFVVGGGRWNSEQNPYDNAINMVINDIDEMKKRIDICIEGRIREFNDYRQQIADVDINAELDKYDGQMEFGFSLFSLGKMIDMLNGNWDYNSYFYDAEHGSTNSKYMLDSIASGSVDWYLVPVDFHF